MEHAIDPKERDALYAQLRNEAASLDTIHEMLGSGKWTMDFDEFGVMTHVNWSDEFRRMLGYHDSKDFPNVLDSWSNLLHPDDKERILKEFNETISDYTGKRTYDVEYRLLTKSELPLVPCSRKTHAQARWLANHLRGRVPGHHRPKRHAGQTGSAAGIIARSPGGSESSQ